MPEVEHNNIALTFDQNIGIVHLFGDAYYSHRDYTRLAPLSYSPVTVTNANPFFVAPPGTGATSETVNYWFGGQGLGNTWSDKGYSDQHEETIGAEPVRASSICLSSALRRTIYFLTVASDMTRFPPTVVDVARESRKPVRIKHAGH